MGMRCNYHFLAIYTFIALFFPFIDRFWMESLSTQQRRILSEYQSITHSEDVPNSIRILDENDWDLETSVQNRYIPSGYKRQRYKRDATEDYDEDNDSPSSTSALLGHSGSSTASSSTAQRKPKWRILTAFMWPFNFVGKITWHIFHYSVRLIYRPTITPPRRRDPRSEADRFLQNFESTYGTIHPDFFSDGGYMQALKTAKDELKYMMAILCSEEHDDNDTFCRQVLADTELLEFLRQHEVVVWAGNVRYAEAYQVSNILQATTYPFVGIIALQPPTSNSTSSSMNCQRKMVLMDRIEGLTSASSIVRRMETVMQLVDASLQSLREEQEQRETERRLRQQQDEAYLESLRADQEKQKQKEAAEKAQVKRELRARLREQYIKYLCQTIPEEPTTAPSSSNSIKSVTKINFRMANGERVLRKFKADDTLKDIYNFVEAYPYLKEMEEGRTVNYPSEASTSSSARKNISPIGRPESYVHRFNFSIHTSFPRKVYEADDNRKLADEEGLWPSATLIVDTIDNEEEDKDDF
ncbi:UBX domain-containing protein [Mycotypha africana]|uniref:UBX domain-containing protein n=1 Tax=Mycotypha africana TaxID=64632 RepID=UPI0023016E00|nr:UBX domain-containing protein [Mycotypha africana]KAI8970032.1 UBX domain-containing protein [Mycotypha africana]